MQQFSLLSYRDDNSSKRFKSLQLPVIRWRKNCVPNSQWPCWPDIVGCLNPGVILCPMQCRLYYSCGFTGSVFRMPIKKSSGPGSSQRIRYIDGITDIISINANPQFLLLLLLFNSHKKIRMVISWNAIGDLLVAKCSVSSKIPHEGWRAEEPPARSRAQEGPLDF